MIGNIIKYADYPDSSSHHLPFDERWKREEKIGLVVDAFTKITGSVKGAGILGFSETKGETTSNRYYLVEIEEYGRKKYIEINHALLIEIVEFAHLAQSVAQSQNEEKFK